jgi:D-alanyl-lipoteichoic acid acyltransferase DltB (MBOAT superfamily)
MKNFDLDLMAEYALRIIMGALGIFIIYNLINPNAMITFWQAMLPSIAGVLIYKLVFKQ